MMIEGIGCLLYGLRYEKIWRDFQSDQVIDLENLTADIFRVIFLPHTANNQKSNDQ